MLLAREPAKGTQLEHLQRTEEQDHIELDNSFELFQRKPASKILNEEETCAVKVKRGSDKDQPPFMSF